MKTIMAAERMLSSVLIFISFLISLAEGGEYCFTHCSSFLGTNCELSYCRYGCCGSSYDRYCCGASVGLIVGCVIAAITGACLIAAVVCCFVKKKGYNGRVVGPHGGANVTVVQSTMGYSNAGQGQVYAPYPGQHYSVNTATAPPNPFAMQANAGYNQPPPPPYPYGNGNPAYPPPQPAGPMGHGYSNPGGFAAPAAPAYAPHKMGPP